MSDPKSVAKSKPQASDLGFPLFSPGQMLQHDDLTALADYTRNLTRLMLRSLFGCGVVCGLCVKAEWNCNALNVTVEPGVALDCCGDPVHVTSALCLTVKPECDFSSLDWTQLWVVLRGFRKCCAPRPATCSSDEDEVKNVCTREKYYYEVQLWPSRPECACGCAMPDTRTARNDERRDEEAFLKGGPALVLLESRARECYLDHYRGKCACGCTGCDECDCEWIVLAAIEKPGKPEETWNVWYEPRRYVRPMLAPDLGCRNARPAEELDVPIG